MLHSRGVEAEWVLKIGNDEYYGFGYGRGKTIENYNSWLNRLAKTYNQYTGLKINSEDVVGYYGRLYMMDYFKLAQAAFNKRNK